jgi:hypothetical protein
MSKVIAMGPVDKLIMHRFSLKIFAHRKIVGDRFSLKLFAVDKLTTQLVFKTISCETLG